MFFKKKKKKKKKNISWIMSYLTSSSTAVIEQHMVGSQALAV